MDDEGLRHQHSETVQNAQRVPQRNSRCLEQPKQSDFFHFLTTASLSTSLAETSDWTRSWNASKPHNTPTPSRAIDCSTSRTRCSSGGSSGHGAWHAAPSERISTDTTTRRRRPKSAAKSESFPHISTLEPAETTTANSHSQIVACAASRTSHSRNDHRCSFTKTLCGRFLDCAMGMAIIQLQ